MAAPLAIRAAAWHLPERRVEPAALPERATVSRQERERLDALGIERLCVDDELSAHDLAVRAARDVMAQAGLGPADVGALIVVESRAPHELLTSEATRLQEALGAHRALANRRRRRYRRSVTLNGDGGQALVLGRTGRVRVLDVVQETNGASWDLFHVAYRDRPFDDWREECRDLTAYSFRLAVESRNRLRRLLDRNGMRPGDVRGTSGRTSPPAGTPSSRTCWGGADPGLSREPPELRPPGPGRRASEPLFGARKQRSLRRRASGAHQHEPRGGVEPAARGDRR